MMNRKPAGPRMTKRARERKREADKADKALGGGVMVEVDGEDATKKVPHWYVELQWFRLLRGQARLNQIARILVELAPSKVFDPRDIFSKRDKDDVKLVEDEEEGAKKSSKTKKVSRKEQIIAANNIKKQKEAAARDAEKLRTLGNLANANIKLKTESGKLLLLLSILKRAVQENNVVDTLDTMWEIEDVAKEIDPKEAKAAFKPYGEVIKAATEFRSGRTHLGGLNLVDFQLTSMSDRLPPLNLHSLSGKFKLDDWQLHVINLINQRKSVLITAPTSSGKTVLSTYVCTSGARVLFVVPSEPLAWQVAAMLRALKVDISIVVPTLNYVPPKFDVVVGTPSALESTLTKQIGFEFDYAVFDEVHSLNNNPAGPALQRLIRAIPRSCKILALSATIGNASQVLRWWETIVGEGEIELVVHKSRFINLQRFVWTSSSEERKGSAVNDDGELIVDGNMHLLHPCASLTVDYLASEEYTHSDIAFTPVDAYNLYKSMDAFVTDEDVSDLKPKKYFASKPGTRITLMQAKEYEDELKQRLVSAAKRQPEMTSLLLASLSPGVDLKKIKKSRKAVLAESSEAIKKFDVDTATKTMDSVQEILEESASSTSKESLCDLAFYLHKSERLPAICFQLDSVWCQSMFDGLLRELEEREARTHPEYRKQLEKKAKGLEKMREKASKRKGKTDEDEAAEAQEFGELGSTDAVDVDAPHPDFVLTPPGRGMGLTEVRDIQDKLRDDLPSTGEQAHPLIRGLRRGIGMYIVGLPSAYHRLLQSFAQQGRLGIVFSDELLAYGVNMPFRSCIFYGDPGEGWLTPLLHQQMAGRAGRRGLDRQGHLVYAGFSPARLKNLLRGRLPDVVGKFPLYPTVPLQLEMNSRYEVAGAPLTIEKMHEMCATPLAEYLRGEKVDGYFEIAEKWIDYLGVLKHPASSYSYLVPELVWELRQFLPESLALEYILEPLIKKFKEQVYSHFDKDADVHQQTEMFLVFCRICSREPFVEIEESLHQAEAEEPNSPKAGSLAAEAAGKWVKPLPFPHAVNSEWDEWTEIINASQQRIIDSDLAYKECMLLPVPMDQPLDNLCYASFVRNQIDPSLPTPVQHNLRIRIWDIGEVLRITSNVLGRSSELQPVQNLIRKAFVRIRYILDETAQRNWKKLDEQIQAAGVPPAPPS
mmetsp:Transcript_42854/g.68864  ORF Transcript_42854/g.68864 Transcript_42854/m.68864 type:complete len:1162 (-) Transcript_42854:18-3503(-)